MRDIGAWLPFSLRLLRAARPARFAAAKAALRRLLADAMPAWARLLDVAAAPELLLSQGHFIVWETPESAAKGRAAWAASDTGTATFRDATPEELARLSTLLRSAPTGAIPFAGRGPLGHPRTPAQRPG